MNPELASHRWAGTGGNASLTAEQQFEQELEAAVADIQSGGGVGEEIWLDIPELAIVIYNLAEGRSKAFALEDFCTKSRLAAC